MTALRRMILTVSFLTVSSAILVGAREAANSLFDSALPVEGDALRPFQDDSSRGGSDCRPGFMSAMIPWALVFCVVLDGYLFSNS